MGKEPGMGTDTPVRSPAAAGPRSQARNTPLGAARNQPAAPHNRAVSVRSQPVAPHSREVEVRNRRGVARNRLGETERLHSRTAGPRIPDGGAEPGQVPGQLSPAEETRAKVAQPGRPAPPDRPLRYPNPLVRAPESPSSDGRDPPVPARYRLRHGNATSDQPTKPYSNLPATKAPSQTSDRIHRKSEALHVRM